MAPVDWNEVMSGDYIQIEDGTPKEMILANWRKQEKFKDEDGTGFRNGVTFDVLGEDGEEFEEKSKKEWTVTAKGALKQLRPLCEKADAAGKKQIKITVVAVGEGKQRKYSIKEKA